MRSVGAVDSGPSAQRAAHKNSQGLRVSYLVLYISGIRLKAISNGDDPAASLIWSASYCSTSIFAFQDTRAKRCRVTETKLRISMQHPTARSLHEYSLSTFILY